MAVYHQVGDPVNDGEREVLRRLRSELDDRWHVVGNFSMQQGTRAPYECDALAVGPDGWAYLIEVKAWTGKIVGNDSQWQLPALGAAGFSYRTNPVQLTELKARVLNSVLRELDPPLKAVYIAPLVVLVSQDPPQLTGSCAELTVLVDEMIDRVSNDPREYARRTPEDVASRVAEVLVQNTRPIAPETVVGFWELVEEIEAGPNWEIWSARNRLVGARSQVRRLKRYRLDPLVTGLERDAQRVRARHDLEALERLAGVDGAVPLVGTVEEFEDSLIVVTDWPDGRSLASILESGVEDEDDADELAEAFLGALASIHRENVIHRALSPRCIHFLRSHRVVITDFDYARVPSVEGVTRFIEDELASRFTAPEVQGDPAAATIRSDVWSAARICAEIFGALDDSEAVALERLPGGWRDPLARALNPDPAARQADADLLLTELRSGGPGGVFGGFEPNDELDSRWVVKSEPVGEGGLARVYRVWDTTVGADYAAKFVRPEYAGRIDPTDEYRLLLDVPAHPGLVRPEFALTMSKYRRKGRQHEYRTAFLLTRWVEGTRLDRLIAEKLPAARCCEIVLQLAEGIAHLHAHDLIHRDLKPQNVIVDGTGQARIVDFNVSKTTLTADRTQTGTPRYRPPDLADTGWTPAADVYSLGAVLCELLAGRTLEPGETEWAEDPAFPEDVKLVALRSVSKDRHERYSSAEDLADELRGACQALAAAAPVADAPEQPFPVIPPEELSRPNWNPFQSHIVSLFSQSSVSNAGTRGLNDFARWAYVPTLIDDTLYSDLVAGRYRLLLITGNAGDGKTAFIQMMEGRLQDEGWSIVRRPDGNGAVLSRGDERFVTNWDGSQDEGEVGNDAVLVEFFEPFSGAEPEPAAAEYRVIAINEGRLIDFLNQSRDEFPWLSKRLLAYFEEEDSLEEIPWLAIVNLNLRALTVGDRSRSSLVAKLLEKFADRRLWEPCTGCVAAQHCYARANAATLRDPVLGPRIAERIRVTLDLARLRRQLHITMRDLRSALAWTVAGNRTCDQIVRLVEDNERERLLSGYVYNALFAASAGPQASVRSPEAVEDRLLRIVATLDVARTAGPEDDARLWLEGVEALLPDPTVLERSDRQLLREFRERLPMSARDLTDRRVRADLRLLHSSLRRKLFLEREEPEWIDMLPYDRLERFMNLLNECADDDRDAVTRAISQSEGLFNDEFRDFLAVRLASESAGAERSFATHPANDFVLAPLNRADRAGYVEYAPDSLRLQHRQQPALALDIDLDLYETLIRVLAGFTPSREELRGTWLNLRIFKDQVARLRSDEMLLSRDDRSFHHVRRSPDGAHINVSTYS